jgi:nucleoside-diphosphate-sugar epimerase
VASVPEIIAAMRRVVPAAAESISPAAASELANLTMTLRSARPDAVAECRRFEGVRERGIVARRDDLAAWIEGRSVLVTGGTGCVGSVLMTELGQFGPGRIVSVSRGVSECWRPQDGAEYASADVTDPESLSRVFDDVRPDIVFHLAAQRDPGRAEIEVRRTLLTNLFGTRNVMAAVVERGVPDLICATSGKALRPYSREVYTATKRVTEWLLATAAATNDCRISAVRFTHVVDNSIIYTRLQEWCEAGIIRLHDPEVMFYVQSALECAQLMLAAGLDARTDELRISAITDLGWPVNLLDLAVGMLELTGSRSPIYFSGHDPGYEAVPFPGLYDPRTAADVSPLLSAFEAVFADQTDGVDSFPLRMSADIDQDGLLRTLEEACAADAEPDVLRAALDDLSWASFDATIAAVPRDTLVRITQLTAPRLASLRPEHRRMHEVIKTYAFPADDGAFAAPPAGRPAEMADVGRRPSSDGVG